MIASVTTETASYYVSTPGNVTGEEWRWQDGSWCLYDCGVFTGRRTTCPPGYHLIAPHLEPEAPAVPPPRIRLDAAKRQAGHPSFSSQPLFPRSERSVRICCRNSLQG